MYSCCPPAQKSVFDTSPHQVSVGNKPTWRYSFIAAETLCAMESAPRESGSETAVLPLNRPVHGGRIIAERSDRATRMHVPAFAAGKYGVPAGEILHVFLPPLTMPLLCRGSAGCNAHQALRWKVLSTCRRRCACAGRTAKLPQESFGNARPCLDA